MSRARYEMQDPGADSRSSKISLWGRIGLHDANSFGNHPSYKLTPPWEPSKLGPSWMLWGGGEEGGGEYGKKRHASRPCQPLFRSDCGARALNVQLDMSHRETVAEMTK